jgi:hypothetical protein
MRLLPICLLIFSCLAYAQEVNNPNNLPSCPIDSSSKICWGKIKFTNGEIYVGEIKGERENGVGTTNFINGDKYIGEYKDGKKNGKGKYTFANGNEYTGEFKDGEKHGWGKLGNVSGYSYAGEWADGAPDGRGIETFTNSPHTIQRQAREGIFKKGRFVRAEKVTLPDQIGMFDTDSNRSKVDQKEPEQKKRKEDAAEEQKRKEVVAAEELRRKQEKDEKRRKVGRAAAIDRMLEEAGAEGRVRDSFSLHECSLPRFALDRATALEYLSTIINANVKFPAALGKHAIFMIQIETSTGKLKFPTQKIEDEDRAFYNAVERSVFLIDAIPVELSSLLKSSEAIVIRADDKCYGKSALIDVDVRKFYGSDSRMKRESPSFAEKKPLSLEVEHRQLDSDGTIVIDVKTGVDTASLRVNGEELGGKFDGIYSLKRIARAGQETRFVIDARDLYGNKASKEIVVKRSLIDSSAAEKKPLSLEVEHRQIDSDGTVVIDIKTGVDTASLRVNGEELGGKFDGIYSLKRIARAGQETRYVIDARDLYGNKASKEIVVKRSLADSSPRFVALNPSNIKKKSKRNAVAIVIGIQRYKRLTKADFANDDARVFYDYAIRALGVKPENIKMLIDDQADQLEIFDALHKWLPTKVDKNKTDVFVFYSGHGLPSDDGKSLYFLPYGVDSNYLNKTAISQQEFSDALQAVQPKSVTMFIDTCYSGQVRTGEALVANVRPVQLKAGINKFPTDFTVFTASAPDQMASSSSELKHGIFSFYVMKGMEGDADENKDGKITSAELQDYVSEMVGRQSMVLNRRQQPQLIGDAGRVVVDESLK